MSQLLDKDGNVHEQGAFSGQWQEQHGWFGSLRDTDWLGRPNVDHDFWGNPKEARDFWGRPITSADGKPLYESANQSGGSGASGGGDFSGAMAGILVVVVLMAAAACVSLLYRLLKSLYDGWRGLVDRYPTAMLIIHLALAMAAVGGTLRVAGFDLATQVGGMAGVLLLWLWLRLTRRLPLIFMPINALFVGGGLWLAAEWTRASWEPVWSRLAEGLPIAGHLPLLLALFPLAWWVWGLANRRFPDVCRPVNFLLLGAPFWFLLLRVWTDWLPYWQRFTAPIPHMPAVGWFVFLSPLMLWLWGCGQVRWPVPFTALGLLIFGGLLGLTAFHTEPLWVTTWQYWMAGLPFVGVPIVALSLSPLAFWGWGLASRRWSRFLAVPNLLITGGICWLVLDRTRGLWQTQWRILWGPVPLTVDPALLALVLPVAWWAWSQGSRRWPRPWGIARVLLWTVILWWVAERTGTYWRGPWQRFAGENAPNLARLALGLPLLVWLMELLHARWPRSTNAVSCLLLGAGMAWFTSRLFPGAHVSLFLVSGLAPLALLGWIWLVRRNGRVGLGLVALPLLVLVVGLWLAPSKASEILGAVFSWLVQHWFVLDG